VTVTPDQRPDEPTLDLLRSAFPHEWREPALGYEAIEVWVQENEVTLPEPYRSFVAEISNGCSLGPAEDGGLQPLGWLPSSWPEGEPRQPGAPFPLEEAWLWEDDDSADDEDSRIDAVFFRQDPTGAHPVEKLGRPADTPCPHPSRQPRTRPWVDTMGSRFRWCRSW
jgi:hypothetical protein